MDYKNTASEIINDVGGKKNIKEMFHCVTRLRMYLNDDSKVDLDALKSVPGVLGAQFQGGQLQVIIGNDVDQVYNAAIGITGFIHSDETEEQKQKMKATGLFETLAAIFLPVVPAMAGCGMIKGIITIMTSYMGFSESSDLIMVLTIAGDCIFYFLPFFVAWSAAKRFDTDIPCAMAIAACLLYPTMTEGYALGLSPMHFIGLPIPFVRYTSSTVPIILSVWVLKYVYKWIDRIIPKAIRLVFTPMVVMLIMAPLSLSIVAPLASNISQILVYIINFLYGLSPIIAGAIVGGTRLFVVMTGMHMSLSTLIIGNIDMYGSDFLLPMNTMGTLALFGACMGVLVFAKNQEDKSIGGSTAMSAFIGITEPGIYGVFLKFKNAMIATVIGGAVGGAIVGAFGGRSTAYVNSCILSLPVFMGPGFWSVCVGMAVAAGLAFIVVMILGVGDGDKAARVKVSGSSAATAGSAAAAAVISGSDTANGGAATDMSKQNEVIFSPMNGSLIQLKDVKDDVFASGMMGKGIAIDPDDGTVVAPFDGTVVTVYPTKHAIGLKTDSGIECVIHIGLDTANLKGKYFDIKVSDGQKIKAGDVLAEVDLKNILKEGYSVTTPVIITNSADYMDIIPYETEGIIVKGEPLLTVVKNKEEG